MPDFKNIFTKIKKMQRYIESTMPVIIGTEAINHFQESFTNQGFTDKSLEKWDDVKRRDSNSSWYGFEYGSNANRPGVKRRKKNSTSHYSHAATKRPILSGQTQNLFSSFSWKMRKNVIIITAGTDYSQAQNEGAKIKIFGKKETKLPKRQFMGQSMVLKRKLEKKITKDLIQILKS